MNALITDDELIAVNGMLAGIDWKSCGIEKVYTAYNAEDAKKICEEQKIGILLCDIEMPGENGIDLVRWLREYHPEIECLFLTCHADFKYAVEAVHLGCRDYLVKPVPYVEIEEALKRIGNQISCREENRQLAVYGRQWIQEKKEKSELEYGKKVSAEEVADIIERFVMSHLAEDISVEQIARTVALHPDYLNRLFKKVKKQSINRYIIDERMKIAARMLEETDISVNVIAMSVGYTNYPNFSNMFKKIYGMYPISYRGERKK